jgi:hypothetical protein
MRLTFFLLFFSLVLESVSAQPIERYFLGLPYMTPNAMQIDKMKSDSRFRPSYKSDYPEWVYFDAEYLDNRAIDPDCDSIKVVLTSGHGSLTNFDRTIVIFFYSSRSIQIEKYEDLQLQLKYQHPNFEYISSDDITNLSQNKLDGIVYWLSSDYYPSFSLFQTTDEGLYAVILEYTKVNNR